MTGTPAYRDASLPVPQRIDHLPARMTLEVKVGQMCQLDGRKDATRILREKHVGSLLHIMGEPTIKLQEMAGTT